MSLIQRLTGVTLTSPGLKMYREALFNTGSLYGYDILDTFSLNGIADGVVTDGSTLKNLIKAGTDATFKTGSANASLTTKTAAGSGNGFTITPNGGFNASWDVGKSYDLSASQHAFLVTVWFKPGPQTTNRQEIIQSFNGGSFANIQYALAWNPSTLALIGGVGTGGATAVAGITSTAIQQVAIAWYVNSGVGTLQLFKNGALVATQTSGIPTTLPTPDAGNYFEGFGFNNNTATKVGTLYNNPSTSLTGYRWYKEDLTISAVAVGKTIAAQALAQVQADWNANHVRYGI